MNFQVETERFRSAYETVRQRLLDERNPSGCWIGKLSSSPFSTATAVSALVLTEHCVTSSILPVYKPGEKPLQLDRIYSGDLSEMIVSSLHWLAQHQNEDGGWGDTENGSSNLATTMTVLAAFHLTAVPAKYRNLLERADDYIKSQGGFATLKQRHEGDRLFVVPILANCALADMISWRKVSALPFELAALPHPWSRFFPLPVLEREYPVLIALGIARFHHAPPRNPLARWTRSWALKRCLKLLEKMQPSSGGYYESIPLTSFIVMSLASVGLVDHSIVRRGVEFLLSAVRPDGSWPVIRNLSTGNTAQAVLALDWQFEQEEPSASSGPSAQATKTLDWLLTCQHREVEPTLACPEGGWASTDLPGGIADAQDTALVLQALAAWMKRWPQHRTDSIRAAARLGIKWLLEQQNPDGGWASFSQSNSALPADQSSADIIALALRALHQWLGVLRLKQLQPAFAERIEQALHQGLSCLKHQQRRDGCWRPLDVISPHEAPQRKAVYTTAQVLLAYEQLGQGGEVPAEHGARWLLENQLASGCWGAVCEGPRKKKKPSSAKQKTDSDQDVGCSVEETSLAIQALLPYCREQETFSSSVSQGVGWLINQIEQGEELPASPLGFRFGKIWYHERLYPHLFAMAALRDVLRAAHAGVEKVRIA